MFGELADETWVSPGQAAPGVAGARLMSQPSQTGPPYVTLREAVVRVRYQAPGWRRRREIPQRPVPNTPVAGQG